MATKLVIKNGVAEGVYDDRLLPLYEALGLVRVLRASTVEFNHDRRCWEARACDPKGTLIASGRNRAEVIRAEVDHLERGL